MPTIVEMVVALDVKGTGIGIGSGHAATAVGRLGYVVEVAGAITKRMSKTVRLILLADHGEGDPEAVHACRTVRAEKDPPVGEAVGTAVGIGGRVLHLPLTPGGKKGTNTQP